VVTLWPGPEFFTDGTEEFGATEIDLGDRGWVSARGGHVMWVEGEITVDVMVPLGGPTEAELISVARAVSSDLP
jgi:hypothetical protein